jgi:hypothetical protein
MIADNWIPLLGVPIIAALVVQTVRRLARLRTRIDEVREEQARNPLPPYAQLSQLMQERSEERKRGQRSH